MPTPTSHAGGDAPTRILVSNAPPPMPDRVMESTPERTVIGGYRLYEASAFGPLGKVYRARLLAGDPRNVCFLAFHRPPYSNEDSWPDHVREFSTLMAAYGTLEPNPYLQRPLAWGDDDGVFWVAQEWLKGQTLAQYISAHGPQSLPWAVECLRQVAGVVDLLASRGLWHSDLSPENVLLTRDESAPNPYGIHATVLNVGVSHGRGKYGSPFAAPEQQDPVSGRGDYRADIFALGGLLYFLLTGAPPFYGESPSVVSEKVHGAWPQPLPDRQEWLRQVLETLLAKPPAQRYTSAAAAIDDLSNRRPPAVPAPRTVWAAPAGPAVDPLARTLQGAAAPPSPAAVPAPAAIPAEPANPADEKKRRRAERREVVRRTEAKRTVVGWALVGALGLGLAGLLAHAGSAPEANRRVSVDGKEPQRVGASAPLVVATGKGQTKRIETRRARILLGENSRLEVRTADDRGGAILRATLRQGTLSAAVAPPARDDVFELTVGPARVVAEGGGLFTADRRGVGLAEGRGGRLRVVAGEARRNVEPGQRLDLGMARPGGAFVPQPVDLDPATRKRLDAAAASLPAPGAPAPALLAAEDRMLVPAVEFAAGLGSFSQRAADTRRRTDALEAMRRLSALLDRAKAKDGLYPPSLQAQTLNGVGGADSAGDRAEILAAFAGKRLASYRRLPDGKGYVAEARALDSRQSLVRSAGGVAYLLGNDETAPPPK